MSLAEISAGAGYPHPTRLLADRITAAVCRALTAGGAEVEVEVLELHRLAADLADRCAHRHLSLDLREAIATVAAADGLVLATPVIAASPSHVFTSFFAALDDGVLSGTPVLLATHSRAPGQPPGLAPLVRQRLTRLHAAPVPTVVVAGPDDRNGPGGGTGRLRERIDRAAAELATAMHRR